MPKRPETVVGLEIRPLEVRLAELARAGRRVLATARLPLAPGRWLDAEHLSATLRALIDGTLQGRPVRLAASLPLGVANLRRVLAPAGPEAREHLAWDLETWLGEPLDGFAWDHAPLPAAVSGGTAHLVASAPRDVVRTVRDAVERATGQRLALLDVDAAALPRLLPLNYPENPSGKALLVHAHADVTAVMETRAGEPVTVRVLREAEAASDPDSGPQERAEGLLRLARALGRMAADFMETEAARPAVLVGGALAVDPDFRELLRAHVPAATLLNPFRHLAGPDPAAHPEAYPGAPLAAVVALALRADAEDAA